MTISLPKTSSDAKEIKIKNADNFPFMSVNLSQISINMTKLSINDLGKKSASFHLYNNDGKFTEYSIIIFITQK